MTDTFRELCVELLSMFDNYDDESNLAGIFDDMKANKDDLFDRARSALASEPESPTDGKVTKTKRTKKQKEVKIDPSVAKMEKLMGMRLDGIAWFLEEHPIKNNTETQP